MKELKQLLNIPPMDNATKKLAKEVDDKIETARSLDFAYTDDRGNIHVDNIKFSKYFLKKYKLLYVDNKKDSSLMIYNKQLGYWDEINNNKLSHLISNELGILWSFKARRDALTKVSDSIDHINYYDFINSNKELVFNFINGVFNWENMQLEQHDSRYNFTSVGGIELDISNKEGYPELNKWLDETFKEDKQTIMEFIGYCFYPSYAPIQAFILLNADGGDGKSTFINFLIGIIGRNNTSNIPLQDFTKKNASIFKLSNLQGKYLNAHADISDNYITDTSYLKSITGNDYINADVKGKSDVTFRNFAKILYACNELPPFEGNNNAMRRRSNILQFHAIKQFHTKYSWDKILKERPAFIWECIKLAKQAMERGNLTKSDRNLKEVDKWLNLGSPVNEFVADYITIGNDGEEHDFEAIYNVYCNFCEMHGYKYFSSYKFSREFTKATNATKDYHQKHGQRRKYYFIGAKLKEDTPHSMEIHPKDKEIHKTN